MPDLSAWWSYGLSDFLLFSPRTYWRLFELHNAAAWPLQIPALGAGIILIMLALWRPRIHGRVIALVLAILWAAVAWSFFWQRYATINWAAIYVAPLFALEAVLLLVVGALRDRLAFDRPGPARRRIGIALAVFAVAIYPLLAPLFGRPWTAAEVFGIAPDPTVIGTLGLLLLARGRVAILLPIPLLWCLASAVTLWAMDEPQAWVPLGAAGVAGVGRWAAVRT